MIETVQYNASLAITGAIKGTSRERLYQELELESLGDRRCYRRLIFFFNIVTHNSPNYLYTLLPDNQRSYDAERNKLFLVPFSHTNYFTNTFFPYCVSEWNKLGKELRNATSISSFKKSLLVFIRPKSHPVYNIVDPIGLKFLSRLRLNLSHLREHKFRHNFLDTINPLCSCGIEIETTKHYLLHCPFYIDIRRTLLDNIVEIIGSISNLSENKLVELLLYGNGIYSNENNTEKVY